MASSSSVPKSLGVACCAWLPFTQLGSAARWPLSHNPKLQIYNMQRALRREISRSCVSLATPCHPQLAQKFPLLPPERASHAHSLLSSLHALL